MGEKRILTQELSSWRGEGRTDFWQFWVNLKHIIKASNSILPFCRGKTASQLLIRVANGASHCRYPGYKWKSIIRSAEGLFEEIW